MQKGTALVVGATGLTGGNLAAWLSANGWNVYGLSRKGCEQSGVIPIAADLLNLEATSEALAELPVTHVFYCTWVRRDTEKENIEANTAMMRNLFTALNTDRLKHASLVTGTKQYLGSFHDYGSGRIESPFRESEPRVPGHNFYYALEDVLFEAAESGNFKWNVHRPHTVIGYARGNAMNMGVTLAVYASICKATGKPMVFPGSKTQWNALTDMTDANLLARQIEWAATMPGTANQAFNTVNGDTFRWRRMWREIGDYFGVDVADCPQTPQPLEQQMKGSESVWQDIAYKHDLVEADVTKLVSWWHSDADSGREQECVNDMTKSRDFGFTDYKETRAAFFNLFARLRAEKVIPG